MKKTKKDPLVGVWLNAEDYNTVTYTVSKKKGGYSVVACDTLDNEVADIFEEKWDSKKHVFSFAAHWNCTGRFARCRLSLASEDQATLIFTYTDEALLIRKKKKA